MYTHKLPNCLKISDNQDGSTKVAKSRLTDVESALRHIATSEQLGTRLVYATMSV